MNGSRQDGPGTPARVLGIGTAIALMVAAILVLGAALMDGDAPAHPDIVPSKPGTPIPAEAGVFRTRPGDLAVSLDAERRGSARPRDLERYRAHRAFPGAPPAIPHGLTEAELKGTECNTCHERGGYVPRFAAYVPVTPHPELRDCLQCHVPNDAIMGLAFPGRQPEAVCLQCHVLDATPATFAELDWRGPAWPEVGQRPTPESPPLIPHGFQLRHNCLACHMGAGAVEEIRTDHPERTSCRQCHLPAGGEPDAFTRPATPPGRSAGDGE